MKTISHYVMCTAFAIASMVPMHSAAESLGDLEKMNAFIGIMEGYLGIIETTHEIDSHPEKAAIMQMQKIQEVYESRGEKVRSVDELRKVLEQTKNQTIRNAAYMLMSDTLKETGRGEEALELLRKALSENIGAAD